MKRFDHEIIRPRPIDAVDCTICAQWRRAVQHLDPYTAVDTQDSMDCTCIDKKYSTDKNCNWLTSHLFAEPHL